jgi:hypothetical protein
MFGLETLNLARINSRSSFNVPRICCWRLKPIVNMQVRFRSYEHPFREKEISEEAVKARQHEREQIEALRRQMGLPPLTEKQKKEMGFDIEPQETEQKERQSELPSTKKKTSKKEK